MPLRNRVSPEGEIVADTARGTMMGNRGGCFHRPDKTLKPRLWASRAWIACRLEWKGMHRQVMQPGLYTELFFLDEATALAAGHRPCAYCRRGDFDRFMALAAGVLGHEGRLRVTDLDPVLHRQRIAAGGTKVTFEARAGDLPDGTMVRREGRPWLLTGGRMREWTFSGYGRGLTIPTGAACTVLTPRIIVSVLAAGYVPALHETACPAGGVR